MSNALKFKNSELATLLDACDKTGKRKAAIDTALLAISHVELSDPIITEAIQEVKDGKYGNQGLITKLSDLADNIEKPYINALDRAAPVESSPKLMALFAQARAVTSLYLAMGENIQDQAGNAIYEALFTGIDPEVVKESCIHKID